jgi:hypothetical protein
MNPSIASIQKKKMPWRRKRMIKGMRAKTADDHL